MILKRKATDLTMVTVSPSRMESVGFGGIASDEVFIEFIAHTLQFQLALFLEVVYEQFFPLIIVDNHPVYEGEIQDKGVCFLWGMDHDFHGYPHL